MARTILITGATSGIGKSLALHYAAKGRILGVIGRDSKRLKQVARRCTELGADVHQESIDVRERSQLFAWIHEFDTRYGVDLLFANAGVMEGTPPGGHIEPADEAHKLMTINVLGVQSTVQALLPAMMSRRQGQIAIMSSIAAFVPLPDAPSYCASKAAILNYGLSLRTLLRPFGIGVSIICPGYVETAMTIRESGPKPFKMSAEKAARIIDRGLQRNKALIVFPRFYGWVTRLCGMLPDSLRRWALGFSRFSVQPQSVDRP
jgi:short-subunit dehydrogenase